jgi:AraC-like DNA-binding protein
MNVSPAGREDAAPVLPATEYSPYPSPPLNAAARLLEQVRVRDVSARYHVCAPHYFMAERRIGDDMFFHIAQGRGWVRVEGRETPVEAGDCAHFRRGVLHAAGTDPRRPLHVIAFHYSATVYESLTAPELLGFPDVFRLGEKPPLEAMLREACREYARRPAAWQAGLEALALRLLLHLAREHGDQMQPQPEAENINDLRRLLPALEAMRESLEHPLSMPELARLCHLSPEQFRRVFRRALNTPPSRYRHQLQMEEACRLLRGGSDTVESVARRIGYEEPSTFAHAFRHFSGVTPGRYRAREL